MFRSVGSLLLLFFAFFCSTGLKAQNCFSDWTRRLPITIDNSANASDAIGIQVRLEINTSALVSLGELQSNGLDLRFVDDANCCEPLCFWVESGMNTVQTVIWVKVPFVPANGTAQIVMLHGNPATVTAGWDGDCTFEFFDDFNTGLDTAKWITRGTPSLSTVAGGYLTFAGNNNWEYVRSVPTFSYPIGVHWKGRVTLTPSAGLVMGFEGSDNRYTFRMNGANLGTTYDTDVSAGNAWEDINYPGIPAAAMADGVFEVKSILTGTGKIQVSSFCNQTVPTCTTSTKTLNTVSGASVFVGFSSYSAGYEGTWDHVFVRKRMPIDLMGIAALVSSAHQPPMVGDTTSYCEGDSALLDAGAGFLSYLWSTGSTLSTTSVGAEGTVSWSISDSVCTFLDSTWVSEWEAPEVEVAPRDLLFCPESGGFLTYAGGPFASLLWSTGDTLDSIYVTLPGEYLLTVVDSLGCSNQDTATVTTHPAAVPAIVSVPTLPVCEGTPVVLDAGSGFVSYAWSSGETLPSIEVTIGGIHFVEVTDSNGCTGSDTVEVLFWPLPVPTITDMGSFLDAGAGYASYQWFVDGVLISGEIAQTTVPMVSGFYTVQVTDSNGCTGVSDSLEFIMVSAPSALTGGVEIQLFPNPYQDSFQLSLTGLDDKPVKVELVDVLGRVLEVVEGRPTLGEWTLTMGANGTHGQLLLLRVTQGDRVWTTRAVRR
jgi:hypothetical protein